MNSKLVNWLFAALLLFAVAVNPSKAQSSSDLRINEVLVNNASNYIDDFGQRSPWIEIFNMAYNSVDIGGLYLTDDMANPKKYLILKGQPVTRIPSRGYLVFWADSNTTHGILHLNFNLKPGKTIALFDGNGKTVVDSMTIPASMSPDVSFGRGEDGLGTWGIMEKTTPGSGNKTQPDITAGEIFVKMDPLGAGMTIISMSVVFTALLLLFLFFRFTSRILKINVKKQLLARSLTRAKAGVVSTMGDDHSGLEITGEINAAITMALYLYSTELHDAEKTVLTINKVSRTYSPWSSKIYGLRKSPK